MTELRFCTDDVADISPVRALKGLEPLECPGNFLMKGKLVDLTPLRGLALKRLKCNSNPVDDLSPLRDMPLTVLICGEIRVHDLSPLKGMRLEAIMLQRTQVTDLTPRQGMPLEWLDLAWAREISGLVWKGRHLGHSGATAKARDFLLARRTCFLT